MGPIDVVTSGHHRSHDPPFELNEGRTIAPVWERPARVDAIERALHDAGHRAHAPIEHADDAVTAVHDPAMVDWLRGAYAAWRADGCAEVMIADTYPIRSWSSARYPSNPRAQLGWWCMDTATPLVAGSFDATRASVDIALTAADLVIHGADAAYGLCRPPGHHAGRDYFGGFCLLNPAAVTAHRMTSGGRVAVLDIDYHHGNGTQDIFWARDDVLYVSLHADPSYDYPWFTGNDDEVGAGAGRGATRNFPLPATTDPALYLTTLERACEVIAAWGPASLVVSLGLDTFHADPIAGLGLQTATYPEVGAAIAQLGLPTVLLQEGGYAIDALGANVAAVLRGFADAR